MVSLDTCWSDLFAVERKITMERHGLLDGKRILIVDDEPDVLDTLEDLLPMCEVVKASSFESARGLLDEELFDLAILDIMGVDGYGLLQVASRKKVPAVMLTAHAVSPEHAMKSYKDGAASYVPKHKIRDITTFLEDVLQAKEKGKDPWWRWLSRLASFWKGEFDPDWQRHDQEFWDKLKKL